MLPVPVSENSNPPDVPLVSASASYVLIIGVSASSARFVAEMSEFLPIDASTSGASVMSAIDAPAETSAIE